MDKVNRTKFVNAITPINRDVAMSNIFFTNFFNFIFNKLENKILLDLSVDNENENDYHYNI
jgi:hypothetical protein